MRNRVYIVDRRVSIVPTITSMFQHLMEHTPTVSAALHSNYLHSSPAAISPLKSPAMDPTQQRTVTQDDLTAQGHLSLRHRFHHIIHREINPSRKSCGAAPCASRLPDARLNIFVLGGEDEFNSHIVRGLTNPAYVAAWDVRVVEWSVVAQCSDVASLAEKLRGAHTVISAHCPIRPRGSGYVDVSDDERWCMLIDACKTARVKRFVPTPLAWDLQITQPAKKKQPQPELIRRAVERREVLTNQDEKDKDKRLSYMFSSVGMLTEHCSPRWLAWMWRAA